MADWYVDLSATNNGDGTDGNQAASGGAVGAWNQLTGTELASVNPGDTVWLRRTGTADKQALTFKDGTLLGGRISFRGWPKSTDQDYSERPTGQSASGTWDADGDDWVYANNPGSSDKDYQYINFSRIHWEETGSTENGAFYLSSTATEVRFYECRATCATGDVPAPRTHFSLQGLIEFDHIDVVGDTTNDQWEIGGSSNSLDPASVYAAVRVTITSAGSAVLRVWDDGSRARFTYIKILEWNDSGSHWVGFENTLGQGGGTFTFTTDDDAVGILPLEMTDNAALAPQGVCILRNLSFDHSLSPAPTTAIEIQTTDRLFLENFEFHPTDHTYQFDGAGGNFGEIIGRNIRNFDPAKVNYNHANTAADPRDRGFIHLSQINDTEGWYRNMQGSVTQLTNVNRTGGAANGILVELKPLPSPGFDNRNGNPAGHWRFEEKGIEAFAFVREGLSYPAAQTLTVYFAVANWEGTEDETDIWFEVEQYKNAAANDFTRKVIDSRDLKGDGSSPFIADGSVWNNITGETAYRIEIPVTIQKDDIIRVRMFIKRHYQTAGGQDNLVVFDPAATLA